MFILGHMGIGSKLVSPWTSGLPKRWVLIGTIFPDILDKSVYYSLALLTGKKGAELGLISGTRTFGHTAILLLLITFASTLRRSRWMAALALGMATHLLLDSLGEHFSPHHAMLGEPSAMMTVLLFPFIGFHFPALPFANAGEHLSTFLYPYIWGSELVGALLLGWDWWKSAHKGEILTKINLKRQLRKLKLNRKRGSV